MSYDDFSKCTFEEFEGIYKSWSELREARIQEDWERTRTIAAIVIQPHVKKKITPRQLLPLPWDSRKKKLDSKAPELTVEEQRKRMAKIVSALGDEMYH